MCLFQDNLLKVSYNFFPPLQRFDMWLVTSRLVRRSSARWVMEDRYRLMHLWVWRAAILRREHACVTCKHQHVHWKFQNRPNVVGFLPSKYGFTPKTLDSDKHVVWSKRTVAGHVMSYLQSLVNGIPWSRHAIFVKKVPGLTLRILRVNPGYRCSITHLAEDRGTNLSGPQIGSKQKPAQSPNKSQ